MLLLYFIYVYNQIFCGGNEKKKIKKGVKCNLSLYIGRVSNILSGFFGRLRI